MHTMEAILGRRSIRRFEARPIPHETLERLLEAVRQAPSAKNAQPWRLVVVQGAAQAELVRIMAEQADRLEGMGVDIGSLCWTAKAMAPAPATVLFYHAAPPPEVPEEAHGDYAFVMLQSTGAAIQNLLLAALDEGLGSLWICDVLYCANEINAWLGREEQTLVAAVTLGYAAEAPDPRPRRPLAEMVEWRG
jgi:nitroreductase